MRRNLTAADAGGAPSLLLAARCLSIQFAGDERIYAADNFLAANRLCCNFAMLPRKTRVLLSSRPTPEEIGKPGKKHRANYSANDGELHGPTSRFNSFRALQTYLEW
jgi:hypothetical protein